MTQPHPNDTLNYTPITHNTSILDPIHNLIAQKQAELNDAREYRYATLVQQYNNKEQQYAALLDQFNTLQSDFTYNITLLHDRDAELAEYEHKLQDCAAEVSDRDGVIEELNGVINELDSKYKQLYTKQQSYHTELDSIKSEHAHHTAQLKDEFDQQLHDIQAQYESKTNELYNKVNYLTDELQTQKSDFDTQYNLLDVEKRLRVSEKQYTIDEQIKDIEALKTELERMQQQVSENTQTIQALHNENSDLHQQAAVLDSKLSNNTVLNEYESKLTETVAQLHRLQQQLDAEQALHVSKMSTVNDQHKADTDTLHSHVAQLQSSLASRDNECKRLSAEIERLRANESDSYTTLQAEYEQLQHDAQQTVLDFTQQLTQRDNDIQILHTRLAAANTTIDERRNELTAVKIKLKAVEIKYDESQRLLIEHKYDHTQQSDIRDNTIAGLKQEFADAQNRLDSVTADRAMVEKKYNMVAARVSEYQFQLAATRAELLTLRHEYNLAVHARTSAVTAPQQQRQGPSPQTNRVAPLTARTLHPDTARVRVQQSPPAPATPATPVGQAIAVISPGETARVFTQNDDIRPSVPASSPPKAQPSVIELVAGNTVPSVAVVNDNENVISIAMPTRTDTEPGSSLIDISNNLAVPDQPKHQRRRSRTRHARMRSSVSTWDDEVPADENSVALVHSHRHRVESTDMTEIMADEFASIEPIARPAHQRRGSMNDVPDEQPLSRPITQPQTPHIDDEVYNESKHNHRSNTAFIVPNSRRGTLNLQAELVENTELRDKIHGGVSMEMAGMHAVEEETALDTSHFLNDSTEMDDGMQMMQQMGLNVPTVGNADDLYSNSVAQSQQVSPRHSQTQSTDAQYTSNYYNTVAQQSSVQQNAPTANNNNESVSQRAQRLTSENNQLRQQNKQIQQVIAAMRGEMQNLIQQSITSAQPEPERIVTLQQQIQQLRVQRDDLQFKLNKAHEHNDVLVNKTNTLAAHLNTGADYTAVPIVDDSEAVFLRQYVKQVHDTVESTRTELTALRNEADIEYDKYRQHLAALATTQNQLIEQVKQYKQYSSTLETDVLKLEHRCNDLAQASTARSTENEQLSRTLHKLRREREKLLEISNELRNDLQAALNGKSGGSNGSMDMSRDDYMYVQRDEQQTSLPVRQTKHGILIIDEADVSADNSGKQPNGRNVNGAQQPARKSRSRKRSSERHEVKPSSTQQRIEASGQPASTHTRPQPTRNSDRGTVSQKGVVNRLKDKSNVERPASVADRLAQLQKLKDNIRKNAGLQ